MNRIIFTWLYKNSKNNKYEKIIYIYIYIYILFLLNITEKILLKNSVYINLIYN